MLSVYDCFSKSSGNVSCLFYKYYARLKKKCRERSFQCSKDNWHLHAGIVMVLLSYRYNKSLSLQAELAPLYSLLSSGNLLYITW